VALLLALLPLVAGGFWLYSASLVMTYGVSVLSVSMLYRFSGEVSIGHNFFMAIGAYTVAILQTAHGVPFLLGLAAGVALSVVMGVLFAWPSRKLSGIYLSVATMALGLCVPELLLYGSKITGGFEGLFVDTQIISGVPDELQQYYVALIALCLSIVVVHRFRQSRIGLAVMIARDHPHAAASFGMKTGHARVSVFALSAALGGLGGGVFAFTTSMVSPNTFSFGNALTLLVGAVASLYSTRIYGAVVGAAFITVVPQLLSNYGQFILIIYGFALVGIILLSNVIMPSLLRRFRRRRPHHV